MNAEKEIIFLGKFLEFCGEKKESCLLCIEKIAFCDLCIKHSKQFFFRKRSNKIDLFLKYNLSSLNYVILFDLIINKISTFYNVQPEMPKSKCVKIEYFLDVNRFNYIKKHYFEHAEIINSTAEKTSIILCALEKNIFENMIKINANTRDKFAMHNSQRPKNLKYINALSTSNFKNKIINYITYAYDMRKQKDLKELLSIISCKYITNKTKLYKNPHKILNILATNILKIILEHDYKFDNTEIIYLSIEEPMSTSICGRFDIFGILKTPDCYYGDCIYMPFVIEVDGNEHTMMSNKGITGDLIKDLYCWLYGISILRIHKLEQDSEKKLAWFFKSMSILNLCTIMFYEKYTEFRQLCIDKIDKKVDKSHISKQTKSIMSNIKLEINITFEDIEKYSKS